MKIFWTYGSIDAARSLLATGKHGRVDSEASGGSVESVDIIREIAIIDVKSGHEMAFEKAVATAAPLFQGAKGARAFILDRSEENPTRYILTVAWESVADHVEGFRKSEAFTQWRALIGDHIESAPQVEHVRNVITAF